MACLCDNRIFDGYRRLRHFEGKSSVCNWRRIEPYPKVMLAFIGNGAKRVTFDYNGTQI